MFRLILTAVLLPLAVIFSTSPVGVVSGVAVLVVLIDHIVAALVVLLDHIFTGVSGDLARAARR